MLLRCQVPSQVHSMGNCKAARGAANVAVTSLMAGHQAHNSDWLASHCGLLALATFSASLTQPPPMAR